MLGVPAHLFYIPLASFNFHRPLLCVLTLHLEEGANKVEAQGREYLTFMEMKRLLSFLKVQSFFHHHPPQRKLSGYKYFKIYKEEHIRQNVSMWSHHS